MAADSSLRATLLGALTTLLLLTPAVNGDRLAQSRQHARDAGLDFTDNYHTLEHVPGLAKRRGVMFPTPDLTKVDLTKRLVMPGGAPGLSGDATSLASTTLAGGEPDKGVSFAATDNSGATTSEGGSGTATGSSEDNAEEDTPEGVGKLDTALRQAEYIFKIKVNGEEFPMIPDTGSSDTWLVQSNYTCLNLTTRQPLPHSSCGFGPLYNGTFPNGTVLGQRLSISYLDGASGLAGPMGYADITLGNLTVPKQQFALVDKAAFAGDGVSSGILGLGLKALTSAYTGRGPVKGTSQNLVRYSSIMETMASSGVADPLFTFAMSRDPDRSHIAFGGIPPVETGEYATVPIQKGKQYGKEDYYYYNIVVDKIRWVPAGQKSLFTSSKFKSLNSTDSESPTSTESSTTSATDSATTTSATDSTTSTSETESPTATSSSKKRSSGMQQRRVSGHVEKRQAGTGTGTTGGGGGSGTGTESDQDPATQQGTFNGTEMDNVGQMLLDSGTTVNMLPQELANKIVAAYDPPGAQLSDGSSYAVYCNATPPELYVTIGGLEIETEAESMILPLTNQNGVCLAGIGAGTKGSFILGDTFFQETVVVFDLDGKTVRVADRTDVPLPSAIPQPGLFAENPTLGGLGGSKNVVLNHHVGDPTTSSAQPAPTGMPSTMGQSTGGKDSENAAII